MGRARGRTLVLAMDTYTSMPSPRTHRHSTSSKADVAWSCLKANGRGRPIKEKLLNEEDRHYCRTVADGAGHRGCPGIGTERALRKGQRYPERQRVANRELQGSWPWDQPEHRLRAHRGRHGDLRLCQPG